MREVLFTVGPFTVYGYGFMIAVGLIAAFALGMHREKKLFNGADNVFDIGITVVLGGALGSKIMYWIVEIDSVIEDPTFILRTLTSGFVVYGGLIGGILAGVIFAKVRKVDFMRYFDLIMPSVALAQGFGRIGCFLAGCCYGKETSSVFSVTFTDSSFAPNGVALIPTQLIMSAGDFLLFAVLMLISRKNKIPGRVGAWYLMLYSVGRFLVEFLRDDPRGSVGPLSTSQFIAIFMFIAGAVIYYYGGRKAEKEACQAAGPAEDGPDGDAGTQA